LGISPGFSRAFVTPAIEGGEGKRKRGGHGGDMGHTDKKDMHIRCSETQNIDWDVGSNLTTKENGREPPVEVDRKKRGVECDVHTGGKEGREKTLLPSSIGEN